MFENRAIGTGVALDNIERGGQMDENERRYSDG